MTRKRKRGTRLIPRRGGGERGLGVVCFFTCMGIEQVAICCFALLFFSLCFNLLFFMYVSCEKNYKSSVATILCPICAKTHPKFFGFDITSSFLRSSPGSSGLQTFDSCTDPWTSTHACSPPPNTSPTLNGSSIKTLQVIPITPLYLPQTQSTISSIPPPIPLSEPRKQAISASHHNKTTKILREPSILYPDLVPYELQHLP